MNWYEVIHMEIFVFQLKSPLDGRQCNWILSDCNRDKEFIFLLVGFFFILLLLLFFSVHMCLSEQCTQTTPFTRVSCENVCTASAQFTLISWVEVRYIDIDIQSDKCTFILVSHFYLSNVICKYHSISVDDMSILAQLRQMMRSKELELLPNDKSRKKTCTK